MVKVKWHSFEYMTDQETEKQYLICDDYPDEDTKVLFSSKGDIWTGFYDVDCDGIQIDSDSGEEIDDTWWWAELPEPPEKENDQQKDRSQT